MSILLDALKKSESQRRLGQAPDIYSAQGGEPSAGRERRNWLPWALLAAVIVLAVWMAWRHLGPAETPGGDMAAAPETAVPDVAAEGVAGADKQQATTAPGETPVEPDLTSRRTPVESLATDERSGDNGAAPPENEPPGVARKAQVNESFTKFSAVEENIEEQPQAERDTRPARSAAAPAAKKAETPAEREDPESPGSAPISFWELPQDIRDSLPELHITVLVFAEEPTERFVLIGGKRLLEKQQVEQGVVLEEIRREGAVFRYRNYRFLVKS